MDDYIRPPFAVSAYKCAGDPYITNFVISHETAHIFGATDEYDGPEQCNSPFDCYDVSGYLKYENQNCAYCEYDHLCIMRSPFVGALCPYTRGHIGWVDSDADGAPDPIDPNSELWASIFPVVPGDLVRIFTISGGFVNLISCTGNNTTASIYPGCTRGVIWDGHNYDNQPCAPGIYLATVNDGEPFSILLHFDDLTVRPVIINGAFHNDSITWYLDSSWAYMSCFIYDHDSTLINRPMWNQAIGYLGDYGIDISSINCFDCYARIWAWRPDGTFSNIVDVPFDRYCIDTLPWSSEFYSLFHNFAYRVEITPDDGYAILTMKDYGKTFPYLRKIDSEECTDWSRSFEHSTEDRWCIGLDVTNDGGFVIAGYQEDKGYLAKTDSLGGLSWERNYLNNDISGYDVEQTSDGGYIIAGRMNNPSSGLNEASLLKTNSAGDEQWRRLVGDGENMSFPFSVLQWEDGGYVVAGCFHPGMAIFTIGFICKTDAAGNVAWTYQFNDTSCSLGGAYEVIKTVEGDLVVVGCSNLAIFMVRLDINGNEIWSKSFSGPQGSSAYGHCVAQTSDSGFIVGGRTGQGMYLIKTYTGGDTVWTKIVEDGDRAFSIKQDSGDGYIVVGSANEHSYLLRLGPQPYYICGDVYADGAINLLDILFLINYVYYSGPDPEHIESANVNCDAGVNMLDILYLIAFNYESGPAPCCEECCQ